MKSLTGDDSGSGTDRQQDAAADGPTPDGSVRNLARCCRAAPKWAWRAWGGFILADRHLQKPLLAALGLLAFMGAHPR